MHDTHTGHAEPAAMTGALGAYPMSRDSSGTAWQPDSTPVAISGQAVRGLRRSHSAVRSRPRVIRRMSWRWRRPTCRPTIGKLSIGALFTINEINRELRPSYGGANPNGAMVFLQFFAGSWRTGKMKGTVPFI